MKESKQRDTNIELLRILAMFMIVCSHSTFSVYNELMEYPKATNSLIQYLISGGGKIGINIFMLISGYYMCKMDITLYKFVKLLTQIYFYDLIIGAILFMIGMADFSIKNIVDYIFPFRYNGIDYFTTAFLFFYVSIPFWRILVDNMSQQLHKYFLMFGYVCYVFYYDIPFLVIPQLDAVLWFGYLYVIAAYIRKYVDLVSCHKKSGQAVLLFMVLIYSSIFALFYWTNLHPLMLFSSANSTLALGFSISIFIWFKGLKIPYSPIVNVIAASTFGVLLIHSGSSPIREVVWQRLIPGSAWFFSNSYIFHMLVSVLILYMVCTAIDIGYKKLIEKRLMDFLYTHIGKLYSQSH